MIFSLRKMGHVARQEVWTVIATKGFLFALVLPVLILFIISSLGPLVERLMKHSKKNRAHPVQVAVIGGTPEMVESWRMKLQTKKLDNGLPLFQLQSLSSTGFSEEILLEQAKENVRSKKWDAIAHIQGDLTTTGKCDLYFMRGFNIELPRDLRYALGNVTRNDRLRNHGYDPAEIQKLSYGVQWEEYEVAPKAVAAEDGQQKKRKADFSKVFVPGIVAVMMMFFLVFTTSQRMLRGIVEEKTSRVVEILLSSVSPTELLAGKVVGFFVIGMIQFTCWVGLGWIICIYMHIPVSEYVEPVYVLQFLIFLATGYLFYASIFATIGAMVSDETESQGLQGIVTMFIVLPMMFNVVFITQPMWMPVRLLSLFPFMTAPIMAVRMVVAQIPWWEITGVAVFSVLCSVAAIVLAARIFRIGILLTGKRPTPSELWRWCFYKETNQVIEA